MPVSAPHPPPHATRQGLPARPGAPARDHDDADTFVARLAALPLDDVAAGLCAMATALGDLDRLERERARTVPADARLRLIRRLWLRWRRSRQPRPDPVGVQTQLERRLEQLQPAMHAMARTQALLQPRKPVEHPGSLKSMATPAAPRSPDSAATRLSRRLAKLVDNLQMLGQTAMPVWSQTLRAIPDGEQQPHAHAVLLSAIQEAIQLNADCLRLRPAVRLQLRGPRAPD